MRLINYLNEDITQECSKIIDFYKMFNFTRFFWRGIKKTISPTKKIVPRKDRRPRDMPQALHTDINNLLYQKFGWFPRSEGVFVTSNYSSARDYGKPYIFLPSNNFNYIYNLNIRDLTVYLYREGIIEYIDDKINMDVWEIKKNTIIQEYTNTELLYAFNNEIEVAFKCDYYYLLTEDQFGGII